MAVVTKYQDWWWSDTSEWNDINWNFLTAKFNNATFQIPHPSQGTNYFQITGNKYLRNKVRIKIGVQQKYWDHSMRIFIYKNKGHVSADTATQNVFTSGGVEPNIFYATSLMANPSYYFLANYEVLYDTIVAKGAAATKFIIYEYKHEEILDRLSPHGLISIAILPDVSENGNLDRSFIIDSRTYFEG